MDSMDKRYEQIVKQYSEALYWHIRRLVVSHEDAQDILQDTLVNIYRKLWQLRDHSKEKAWVFRCATNEVNHFFRQKKRQLGDRTLDEYLEQTLEDSGYVDYNAAAGVRLQKALLTLSPQQRTVFTLKYYDDLDYAEIARITGSKPETLKVSYHNAKEKLKKIIEDDEQVGQYPFYGA